MANRRFPRNRIPLPVTLEAWLLFASLVIAAVMVQTQVLTVFLERLHGYDVLVSFATGVLFSSGIVTAPAIVAIGESAQYVPAWELAVVGALGAVCGDLLLFRFVQSQLVDYILKASLSPRVIRFGRMIAGSPFWWIGPLLGAVVIASPLPDELGLLMMGLSSIRLAQFVPLAFAANVVGIYLVIVALQNIV